MVEDFDRLTGVVMDHIATLGLSKRTTQTYAVCFSQLKAYMQSSALAYSPPVAVKWLQTLEGQLEKTKFYHYRAAIAKLNDLFTLGEIHDLHIDKSKTKFGKLNKEFQSIASQFSKTLSSKTKKMAEDACRHFSDILLDLQAVGINSVSEITYQSLIDEIAVIVKKESSPRRSGLEGIRFLLRFLYKLQLVPYGYTLVVDAFVTKDGYPGNPIYTGDTEWLRNTVSENGGYGLDEYLRICESLNDEMADEKFAQSSVAVYRHCEKLFYLFMDINRLGYAPVCGEIWLDAIKQYVGACVFRHYRRIIRLIRAKFDKEKISLSSNFCYDGDPLSKFPAWCLPDVEQFLKMKKEEGLGSNTVVDYRFKLKTFCTFIDSLGIRAFADLTPSELKRFNETDIHKTVLSKNSYNSSIRTFLEYLGETGRLQNKFLYLSLPGIHAPREILVNVLSEDEQVKLSKSISKDNTSVSLRDKAIIQLGLHMGLRGCDIINLSIDKIDWEDAVIHVVQKKTKYEIVLPMPTQVANAIYRYIMFERPDSSSDKIFLRENAPYTPVGIGACRQALSRALSGCKSVGKGFHVTRRTYATNLLRNNAGLQEVTDALGHRGQGSVNKYIYLDEERMRLCAVSLKEKGISMKGGFKNVRKTAD